jgi:hypothetical protein
MRKTNYAKGVPLQKMQLLLQFALCTVAIGLQAAGRPFTAFSAQL